MLDHMKIVYVVSFMPSFEGATVGGFDWYPDAEEARKRLIEHIQQDRTDQSNEEWTHDYTMRSMLVPRHYSNDAVTEYLDMEMIEFRELPLPPEWAAIRELGGAIDFTKEDKDG